MRSQKSEVRSQKSVAQRSEYENQTSFHLPHLLFAICWLLIPAAPSAAQDTPLTNKYPTTLNSEDSLGRTADAPQASLNASISSSATTFTVTGSASVFPTSGLSLRIDNETILCTTRSGGTFSGCLRGQKGTTATTHASGSIVRSPILSAQREVIIAGLLEVEKKLGVGSSLASGAATNEVLTKNSDGTTSWKPNIGSGGVQVFNIQTYGALCNGVRRTDGAIDNGSSTLTSAGALFSVADTGKLFVVNGAGVAGLALISTMTYVSPTQVTLALPASTTVSGATFFYGSNDAPSINNTIAAATSGGRIEAPYGICMVNSTVLVSGKEGVVFRGSGNSDSSNKGTLFVWAGESDGAVFKAHETKWSTFEDFAILGSDRAGRGFWMTATSVASQKNKVSNVTVGMVKGSPGRALSVGSTTVQTDTSTFSDMTLTHSKVGIYQEGSQSVMHTFKDIVVQNMTEFGADHAGGDVFHLRVSFLPFTSSGATADVRVQSTALWATFIGNYHESKTGNSYLFPSSTGRVYPTMMQGVRVQWEQTTGNIIDYQHTGNLTMDGCVWQMATPGTHTGVVSINSPGGGGLTAVANTGNLFATGASLSLTGNSYLTESTDTGSTGGTFLNGAFGPQRTLRTAYILEGPSAIQFRNAAGVNKFGFFYREASDELWWTNGSGTQLVALSPTGSLEPTKLRLGGGPGLTKFLKGTVDIDPTSIAANTVVEQTFTLTGVVGDEALTLNPPALTSGLLLLQCRVSGENQIAATFYNTTGSAIDQGSGTWIYSLTR